MYWTDWGATARIETSNMDGTSRKVLFNTSLVWPNGLTIDKIHSKLYWADARLDKIEESDLLGANRRVITSQSGIHPFGLTIYDGDLLWTDWMNKSVYSLDIVSGKIEGIASGLSKPMDIHVYQYDIKHDQGKFAYKNSLSVFEYMILCLSSFQMTLGHSNNRFVQLKEI
jgi:low density lipoprotein receptor-related protein 5/6